jgi:hypothetical protein
MKKLLGLILVIIMILGTTLFSYGANYNDINSSHWAFDAINKMSDEAIIIGYPDGTFKPNGKVTYGEFIKMAYLAAGNNDVGNSSSGHWAANYFNAAKEKVYFTAADIGYEMLNNPINRAHMALIISSILGNVKIDSYDEIQKNIIDITVKTKYEYDIVKSYATGILTGYDDQTFKPERTLSRAEAATVIHRLVDESKRIKPDVGNITKEKKTLSQMITNYNSFKLSDGSIDSSLARADAYDIDYGYYDLSLEESNGVKAIYFPNTVKKGAKYLVKDNKVVEYLVSIPQRDKSSLAMYKSEIDTIDYILINDGSYTLTLMPNPFKK